MRPDDHELMGVSRRGIRRQEPDDVQGLRGDRRHARLERDAHASKDSRVLRNSQRPRSLHRVDARDHGGQPHARRVGGQRGQLPSTQHHHTQRAMLTRRSDLESETSKRAKRLGVDPRPRKTIEQDGNLSLGVEPRVVVPAERRSGDAVADEDRFTANGAARAPLGGDEVGSSDGVLVAASRERKRRRSRRRSDADVEALQVASARAVGVAERKQALGLEALREPLGRRARALLARSSTGEFGRSQHSDVQSDGFRRIRLCNDSKWARGGPGRHHALRDARR